LVSRELSSSWFSVHDDYSGAMHASNAFKDKPALPHVHLNVMIRKLKSGQYRLYSSKKNPKTGRRRNLGTFGSRAAAEKHERAVQFFKRA